MDIATFLSNAISALAWPTACLIAIQMFKVEISRKIKSAKTAEISGAKITFGEVADSVVAQLPIPAIERRKLNPREKQVAVLVLSGMRNDQIAEILGISTKTVEVYRATIFAISGTKTIDELRTALAS
jgi:DNA-binding CsgD family transcriptional regulator